MSSREAYVAGHFYPNTAPEIERMIRSFDIKPPAQKEPAIACILPHAGWTYSGAVAAKTLGEIHIRSRVIIIAPKHTGDGPPISLMAEGEWRTPLGTIPIDERLARLILKNSDLYEDDDTAHTHEHAIEVELPLLMKFGPHDIAFVPIVLASGEDFVYKELSRALAVAIKDFKVPVTLIASSDMTHYEPQPQANAHDQTAIEAMLALDDEELLERVNASSISMCGALPAAVVIRTAKALGATRARLVDYRTSGDVTQDFTSVVGYAGLTIQ
jgi:AmmeMemoRadiSam system protein B